MGIHIGSGSDEQCHDLLLARPNGIVECRATARVNRIYRRALFDQRSHAFGIARSYGIVKIFGQRAKSRKDGEAHQTGFKTLLKKATQAEACATMKC